MDLDLLLGHVINKVEEHRTRFPHHKAHIDTELAEKPPAKVFLGHSNDSFNFLHRDRHQGCVIKVNYHDPVLDAARDQKLLGNEITEEGSR